MQALVATVIASCLTAAAADGDAPEKPTTWDGRHSIERIEVRIVYFVPSDRTPLPDWRERVDYYAGRSRAFHEREFDGRSTLGTNVHPEPYRSRLSTAALREGDANAIFFRTLREVDAGLKFAADGPPGDEEAGRPFPILLVLSDMNWRPLDDFWRLKPAGDGFAFEGQLIDGRHHPGAESGGARATYLADRGVGWGLVSGDGWRVPYVGSDAVVYHEGVGHAVGLPHPEPPNGSVMSLAQYQGWISESWLDEEQKRRLGWTPPEKPKAGPSGLFSTFRALPEPAVPRPGEPVSLKFDWPAATSMKWGALRVRVQTELFGPWVEPPESVAATTFTVGSVPSSVPLGRLDRPTPVSYRVEAETEAGEKVELWGYFQVRSAPEAVPVPPVPLAEFGGVGTTAGPRDRPEEAVAGDVAGEIDLLELVDPDRDRVSGPWAKSPEGVLDAPKEYGARIELPYAPPPEYRLTVVAEPLDEPNGLILGQRSGDRRFLALLGFGTGSPLSALENVDGRNVGNNDTTREGRVFEKGRPALVTVDVVRGGVRVEVDGREVIDWKGDASSLSLDEYWETPNKEALFLGAYDCRFRFSRIGVAALSGAGRPLRKEASLRPESTP